MTDKAITMKPGYTDVAGLRDSELWRAVAANLKVEHDRMLGETDRTLMEVMMTMFTIAADDSDGHGLTPELAEQLDRLAASIIDSFETDWMVAA